LVEGPWVGRIFEIGGWQAFDSRVKACVGHLAPEMCSDDFRLIGEFIAEPKFLLSDWICGVLICEFSGHGGIEWDYAFFDRCAVEGTGVHAWAQVVGLVEVEP
jgi:hypothetical protein